MTGAATAGRRMGIAVCIALAAFGGAAAQGRAAEGAPTVSVSAAQPAKAPTGSAALTYYFDNRDYGTINVVTSGRDLPLGLNVWGFVDLHASQDGGDERVDGTRYFTEYRLRRALPADMLFGLQGFGAELEYNDFNGADNNGVRVGTTYRRSLRFLPGGKGWLQVRAHPYETDGSGWQTSLIYSLPISDAVLISGFADLNVDSQGPNRWVAEPQLNVRVHSRLDLALELRYNGYEDANADLDGYGVAFGGKVRL